MRWSRPRSRGMPRGSPCRRISRPGRGCQKVPQLERAIQVGAVSTDQVIVVVPDLSAGVLRLPQPDRGQPVLDARRRSSRPHTARGRQRRTGGAVISLCSLRPERVHTGPPPGASPLAWPPTQPHFIWKGEPVRCKRSWNCGTNIQLGRGRVGCWGCEGHGLQQRREVSWSPAGWCTTHSDETRSASPRPADSELRPGPTPVRPVRRDLPTPSLPWSGSRPALGQPGRWRHG